MLAMARAKNISDAMVVQTKLVDKCDGKKIPVQGKLRTKMLIDETIMHQLLIDKILTEDCQFFVAQMIITMT